MHDALSTIWSTLAQEFSDVTELDDATRIAVRLLMAVLLGGLIGYEREQRRKAAGLRTHMLVALGAAVFVLGPLESGMEVADMSRVLRSEEHTSELQSRENLVCRLLLEKNKAM